MTSESLSHYNSFFWPIMLMPSEQRKATMALYAFCRKVDNDIDELGGTKTALAEWRDECEQMYHGTPGRKVSQQLQPYLKEFNIQKEHLQAMLDGWEMDVNGDMAAPDRKTFELYCERVACAPGLMVLSILDCDTPSAQRVANAMGHALQRTNMLRDLAEDIRDGRLYVPQDLLKKVYLDENEPLDILRDPEKFITVRKLLGDEALRYYEHVDLYLTPELTRKMAPALLMRDVYWQQYRRIQRSGWKSQDKAKIIKASMTSLPMLLGRWSFYKMAA